MHSFLPSCRSSQNTHFLCTCSPCTSSFVFSSQTRLSAFFFDVSALTGIYEFLFRFDFFRRLLAKQIQIFLSTRLLVKKATALRSLAQLELTQIEKIQRELWINFLSMEEFQKWVVKSDSFPASESSADDEDAEWGAGNIRSYYSIHGALSSRQAKCGVVLSKCMRLHCCANICTHCFVWHSFLLQCFEKRHFSDLLEWKHASALRFYWKKAP